MQPSQIMEMIWAGLISRDQERRPYHPAITKMKMVGTVGEPEILLDVVDPVTGKMESWSISQNGFAHRSKEPVAPASLGGLATG